MNTTAMQTVSTDIISNLVLKGDISGLDAKQRVEYYGHVCQRIGLDPATQPFQILRLNGREVLYATKSASEQLTRLYHVSHEIRETKQVGDVFVVCVRATGEGGRFVDATGAVAVGNLKGDALANGLMKAETKAKRRATLSLLGLGMLDETEIETIPGAVGEAKAAVADGQSTAPSAVVDSAPIPPPTSPVTDAQAKIIDGLNDAVINAQTVDELKTIYDQLTVAHKEGHVRRDVFDAIKGRLTAKKKEITKQQKEAA